MGIFPCVSMRNREHTLGDWPSLGVFCAEHAPWERLKDWGGHGLCYKEQAALHCDIIEWLHIQIPKEMTNNL